MAEDLDQIEDDALQAALDAIGFTAEEFVTVTGGDDDFALEFLIGLGFLEDDAAPLEPEWPGPVEVEFTDAPVGKHLAGRHDQKRHAGGGGGMAVFAPHERNSDQEDIYDRANAALAGEGPMRSLDAMSDYQGSFKDCDAIQNAAGHISGMWAPAGRPTPQHEADALSLLRQIKGGDTADGVVYRGIADGGRPFTPDRVHGMYRPGGLFEEPLISATPDLSMAQDFANGVGSLSWGPGLVLRIHGSQGISTTETMITEAGEWITGGRFRVDSVTGDDDDAGWTVDVTHVGVVDPDLPTGGPR